MSRLASTGPYSSPGTRRPGALFHAWIARLRAMMGSFQLPSGAPMLDAVLDSAIDAWPARICVGLMGVLGFPLFYVVWKYLEPQPYESLALRLALAALFLPFLAPRSWLEPLRRYWPWYWHGTLLLALPFFFMFMALENDTTQWALSYLTALMFTVVLAPAALAALMVIVGGAAALLLHLARHPGADLSQHVMVDAWPVMLFAFGGGLILNLAVAQHKRRRTEALLSVAGFVAHELRTPLSAIEMQLDACAHAPQRLAERLPMLQRETRRAHVFIDMLLASVQPTRLQAHQHQPVSIAQVVRNAVQRYPYANEHQRRAVRIQMADDFVVEGVEILLEHLVLNLMKNAYTHGGGQPGFCITISTEIRPAAHVLVVADNGRGIDEHELPRVLQRYYRGQGSTALGSGLGLSFCQDVMRSLGGNLEVESSTRRGTSMKLVFPRFPADQAARTAA